MQSLWASTWQQLKKTASHLQKAALFVPTAQGPKTCLHSEKTAGQHSKISVIHLEALTQFNFPHHSCFVLSVYAVYTAQYLDIYSPLHSSMFGADKSQFNDSWGTYCKLPPGFCPKIHVLLGHSIYKAWSAPWAPSPLKCQSNQSENCMIVSPGEEITEKCSSYTCSWLLYQCKVCLSVSSPVPKY